MSFGIMSTLSKPLLQKSVFLLKVPNLVLHHLQLLRELVADGVLVFLWCLPPREMCDAHLGTVSCGGEQTCGDILLWKSIRPQESQPLLGLSASVWFGCLLSAGPWSRIC